MAFYAHVVNDRTATVTGHRQFDDAEQAARNLAMLMRRFGRTDSTEEISARLVSGETLQHKGFSYRVIEEP